MSKPAADCPECGANLDAGGLCPHCRLKSEAATHSLTEPSPGKDAGHRFGPYRTLRILGEGGMGIVYLAEQLEPIHRRVALKVIKHGLDSKEVIARFESERQALALMDHPNIARVLDAGATAEGVPYFVMEYVGGIPITEYCDRHRLSTRQRLEVFCLVCHAIQHAHQKGVIHRDIKPTNVLVDLVDGRPLPKVIDFGVAKALRQRLTERTLFTQMGMLVGTPAYMSPEQTGGTDLEVDTTTDIYALGVVLYELLVGALPFDPKEMRQAGFAEMVRIIREVEPPKPSERLRSSGARAAEVANLRATDPQMLHRLLRGDLESITMKALDKDRTRRYPSASEFAADIVRHLQDEPVAASPPDKIYRLRKFTRKHRRPIGAGLAVLISLLAGLVISSVLYFRAERQRAEALRMSSLANMAAADLALRAGDVPGAQKQLLRCDPSLRGWEWRLLWRRSDSSLATLYTDSLFTGVGQTQSGFAFSRDRRLIYWGLGDALHVWNAAAQEPLQVYGGFGTLIAVAPDASHVLTTLRRGTVSLIDPASGTVRARLDLPASDRLQLAALSPSGGQIAMGMVDGRLRVWDVPSSRDLLNVKVDDQYRGISFQQDGRRIAALTSHGGVRIWEVSTGRLVLQNQLPQPTGFHPRVEFSPDGRRIAVPDGSTLRVMEVDSGTTALNLPGHTGSVFAARFSPDGALIASTARDDAAVRLWNASSGELLTSLLGHSGGWLESLAFSPDGLQLLAGSSNGEVRIWDVPSLGGELLRRLAHPYSSVALSPNGTRMAVKQLGAGEVWDLNSGGRILSLKTGEEKQCYNDTCFSSMVLNYDCVAYSPDGSRIAAGSRDGSVAIWDARSGAEVLRLRGHSAAVTALAFDRSGAHLASGSGDQIAIVWDLRSGKPVNQMTLTASVTSLAFAPDGDRLLIACGNVGHPAKPDSLVTLWEPLSGRTPAFRFQFPAAATRTWAADLSSDGKLAAATSPAGVFVWERRSGKLLGAADATESSEPTAIAFSPDGSRIVCGTVNGGLRIFDNSGREMLALPGRRSALRTVAFSPDGNRIYSSDENEEVRIWETRSEYVPGSADLVSSLREKLFRWKEIDSRIQADGSLEPKLRQAALQLARRRGDDIGQWSRATSDIVRYPGRTAGEYRAALESAEAALKAFPWHPSLLTVAGAALYRNGRYREALNSLERSESLRAFPSRTDLILIAMTHFQLGETEKARQELKAAVPSRSQFGDQTPQYFLDEADALISSAGSRR